MYDLEIKTKEKISTIERTERKKMRKIENQIKFTKKGANDAECSNILLFR